MTRLIGIVRWWLWRSVGILVFVSMLLVLLGQVVFALWQPRGPLFVRAAPVLIAGLWVLLVALHFSLTLVARLWIKRHGSAVLTDDPGAEARQERATRVDDIVSCLGCGSRLRQVGLGHALHPCLSLPRQDPRS